MSVWDFNTMSDPQPTKGSSEKVPPPLRLSDATSAFVDEENKKHLEIKTVNGLFWDGFVKTRDVSALMSSAAAISGPVSLNI